MTKANDRVFRSDIAGLRAWAVMAVVLFHFGVPGFSGGFVGVDIFFVISGYLMTQIIVNGIQSGDERKFSIFDFYVARARRIVPALLVLCSSLLIVGWFFLPAADYRQLSVHVITSVLFMSNIQYWKEAGYFDAASHDKWLLHTWSLSVEWQFYIILPIILWAIWRMSPSRRKLLIAVFFAFLTSFAISIWMTDVKPEAAYYLLPTRAWEMLAGGLIVLMGNTINGKALSIKGSKCIELIGFVLIVASITTANPGSWPGLAAIVPVLGVMLVLIAERENSIFTNLPILQKIGEWSYSLYLWHWPVVVMTVYLGYIGEVWAIVLGIGVSFIFGWVSTRYVEPFGRKYLVAKKTGSASVVVGVSVLMISACSYAIKELNGVEGRLSPRVEMIASAASDINPFRDLSHTTSGRGYKSHVYGGKNIKVVVMGDSHASAVVTAVAAAMKDPSDGVLGMSYTGCPTLFDVRLARQDLDCAGFNDWALSKLSSLSSDIPVVIVNRGASYIYGNKYAATSLDPGISFGDMNKSAIAENMVSEEEYSRRIVRDLCKFSEKRQVYVLRPIPEMPADVPRIMSRFVQLGREFSMGMSIDVYKARNSLVWQAQDNAAKSCGVKIIDVLPELCDSKMCSAADGDVPRYYDDNHLSERGGRLLVPIFQRIFIH